MQHLYVIVSWLKECESVRSKVVSSEGRFDRNNLRSNSLDTGLSKNSTASSFISYQTRQNLVANLRLLSFF